MSNIIGIGESPRRKEDFRFLTGRGNYVADMKRPDATVGVFIRSQHAHAVIRGIDTTAALALPGVEAILTGDDVAAGEDAGEAGGQGDGARADRPCGPDHGDGVLAVGR